MEYAAPPLPVPDSGPDYMAAGSDGNVWFSEPDVGRIARITPTGITTEFATPVPPLPHGAGMGIAAGTDGIWFSGFQDIGELSFQGALLHDFAIPSAANSANGLNMTLGPDGNLWYTEAYGSPVVGRLTPSGQITEWPIPFNAAEIARGSDGNLWFESAGPGGVGRITPSGDRSYFDGLGGGRGLTAGPDGNLWITHGGNNTIVRFNTDGVQTGVFSVPTPDSGLYGMGAGPDGNVWFTECYSNQIGIIAPDGTITELPIPTPNSGPGEIVAGPDGNVWFGEDKVNQMGEVVLPPPRASLSGVVWEDFNDDGQVDFGEKGLSGVTVTLTGTDFLGNAVNQSQQTDGDGAYAFPNLLPGNYTLSESQPAGYTQGIDSVGTAGGSLSATDQFFVQLGAEVNGLNYNFGERPAAGGNVQHGQTAGIGFWNNKNGQALINALPVVTNANGSVTSVANWLAATLPSTFGSLAGRSNAYVAALFQQDFVMKGVKLDAQLLATALSVYATNTALDPTKVAATYGFTVSGDGAGTAKANVGSNGDAFGVANTTTLTLMDLLLAADAQAVNGVLYNGNTTKRNEANNVFSAVNQAGGL
jgi:streptogramin lyase